MHVLTTAAHLHAIIMRSHNEIISHASRHYEIHSHVSISHVQEEANQEAEEQKRAGAGKRWGRVGAEGAGGVGGSAIHSDACMGVGVCRDRGR
jgi:hypothetical protein